MAKKKDQQEEVKKIDNQFIETINEKRFNRFLEEIKITNDFLKHIATLDTGSILIMATFLRTPTKPFTGVFVGFAALSFVISLLNIVLAQNTMVTQTSRSVDDINKVPLGWNKLYRLNIYGAFIFFFVGLLILGAFVFYIVN